MHASRSLRAGSKSSERAPDAGPVESPEFTANFSGEGSSTRGRTGANMAQATEQPQSEREKVESWRLHVLVEAGYPLPLAEKIAHSEADLHRAVELVLAGCTHETAAEILL